MFMLLFLVTALVALAVAHLAVRMFEKPIDAVLRRIIADGISVAWVKYMKFALYVVAVSSGVRLMDLERYLDPTRFDQKGRVLQLTYERWIIEIYRSAIEALQGIAWLLFIFFLLALMAYVVVRVFELRRETKTDISAP